MSSQMGPGSLPSSFPICSYDDMSFKYVIGKDVFEYTSPYTKMVLEHMEEDEDTTRAIPPWVELEYAVCKRPITPQDDLRC